MKRMLNKGIRLLWLCQVWYCENNVTVLAKVLPKSFLKISLSTLFKCWKKFELGTDCLCNFFLAKNENKKIMKCVYFFFLVKSINKLTESEYVKDQYLRFLGPKWIRSRLCRKPLTWQVCFHRLHSTSIITRAMLYLKQVFQHRG